MMPNTDMTPHPLQGPLIRDQSLPSPTSFPTLSSHSRNQAVGMSVQQNGSINYLFRMQQRFLAARDFINAHSNDLANNTPAMATLFQVMYLLERVPGFEDFMQQKLSGNKIINIFQYFAQNWREIGVSTEIAASFGEAKDTVKDGVLLISKDPLSPSTSTSLVLNEKEVKFLIDCKTTLDQKDQ